MGITETEFNIGLQEKTPQTDFKTHLLKNFQATTNALRNPQFFERLRQSRRGGWHPTNEQGCIAKAPLLLVYFHDQDTTGEELVALTMPEDARLPFDPSDRYREYYYGLEKLTEHYQVNLNSLSIAEANLYWTNDCGLIIMANQIGTETSASKFITPEALENFQAEYGIQAVQWNTRPNNGASIDWADWNLE